MKTRLVGPAKVFCERMLIKLDERFSHLFDEPNFVIASCLHQVFKLNWLDPPLRDQWKSKIECLVDPEGNEPGPDVTYIPSPNELDFLCFDDK